MWQGGQLVGGWWWGRVLHDDNDNDDTYMTPSGRPDFVALGLKMVSQRTRQKFRGGAFFQAGCAPQMLSSCTWVSQVALYTRWYTGFPHWMTVPQGRVESIHHSASADPDCANWGHTHFCWGVWLSTQPYLRVPEDKKHPSYRQIFPSHSGTSTGFLFPRRTIGSLSYVILSTDLYWIPTPHWSVIHGISSDDHLTNGRWVSGHTAYSGCTDLTMHSHFPSLWSV